MKWTGSKDTSDIFVTLFVHTRNFMAQQSNAIYDEYEGYVKKYKNEYGERVAVLLQCGSFYEVYSCDDGLVDIKMLGDILNMTVTKKN